MSRERIIYPNHPEELTWEAYISEYPVHMSNIELERDKCNADIVDIKNKIFAIIGASPKDICNENDDPIEYVTEKMKSLINEYHGYIERLWKLSTIERYNEVLEDGEKNSLYGTIDEYTGKPWKPYMWIAGMYADNEYQCEDKIKENALVAEMFVNKLMMFAASTPDRCFTDCEEDNTSFDNVFYNVREILDYEEGIEYFWWHMLDWQFVKDNFNEDSYNSY